MPIKKSILAVLTLVLFFNPAVLLAEADIQVIKQIQSAGSPMDTCASPDGQMLYVLTRQGGLEIYSSKGVLKENLTLGFAADRIASSRSGDILYLTDSQTGITRMVQLDFVVTINTQGAPFKGSENAPVTLVVFTDFQCFYCAGAADLLEQVNKAFPDQVKIVFKNYPLPMHKFARNAAAAALAAHKQNQFWPMHDLLFKNFKDLNKEKVREFAQTLGLDLEQFNGDRDSAQIRKQIQSDLTEGRKAGVRGTPTIFINGRKLKKRNFKQIKTMVEAQLDKAKKN